jgi:hypothetical protein
MYFAELLRRSCGYKFPRMGRMANDLFVKIAPRFIETKLFPGISMRLDMHDLTQRSTYWQGSRFEHPTAHILAAWGRQGGSAFFDIGSNYGFFSYWMLWNFPAMAVYSFEPNPATFELLATAKSRNNLANDHPELRGKELANIPLAPFDRWREAQGIALPDGPRWVAKIDVEGFELRALKGMAESLRARAFIGLAVEINPFTLNFTGATPDAVLAFMEAHGYRLLHPFDPSGNANAFFIPG